AMTRPVSCCGPSACRSGRREPNRVDHGDRSTVREVQETDGQAGGQQKGPGKGQDAAAREDPRAPALQAVRPAAGGLPQVRHLPDLLPQPGQRRHDPGRQEGELVRAATMMTDTVADMLTRIRNANAIERAAVDMPVSNLRVAIAQVLKDEGFILD